MKHQKTLLALALLASVAVTGTAHASLVDRGNGMLYDNVLNITWLQDANYAGTSGYAGAVNNGKMEWNTAVTWAANLVYGGFSDWRLASNTPVNGSSFNTGYSENGTTDFGYNITSSNSELAYMYNVNLGLKDYVDTAGNYQPTFGIHGNGSNNGQANIGLVNNLQALVYWSGTEYSPGSGGAWYFDTSAGYQAGYKNGDELGASFYAWAVRPGDVAAVPVPGAVWLFGSGLMGLLGFRRQATLGNLTPA